MKDGETYFSSHYFHVTTYHYSPEKGFVKTLDYETAKKYPSFDDTDKIDVLSHESPKLRKGFLPPNRLSRFSYASGKIK